MNSDEQFKILVIGDDPSIREMIEFTLDAKTKTALTFIDGAAEAIELLNEKSSFRCIICNDRDLKNKPKQNLAKTVFQHLSSLKNPPPFIIYGEVTRDPDSHFKSHPPFAMITSTSVFIGLPEIIQNLQGKTQNTLAPPAEFSRIRASIALRFGLLRCDLYTKMSEGHFVKVMREGDMLDLLDLQRFESKKIDFYYIKSEDAKKVMERLSEEFFRLGGGTELTFDSMIQVSTTTLEMISDFSHSCGFSSEVQKLTRLSIDLSIKTIQKNPKLKNLYSRMLVQSDRYLVSHSVLLAHVACGIASLLGMTSNETFYRLALAAFLHDMALDNDELAKIQDLSDLKAHQDTFTAEEKVRFRNHPESAADFIVGMREIPADVHTIVREHHERPDGSGFPKGFTHSKLSPLSSIFIFAENVIHFQTMICTSPDLSQYINSIPPSFYKGSFLPITEAFIRSVNEVD